MESVCVCSLAWTSLSLYIPTVHRTCSVGRDHDIFQTQLELNIQVWAGMKWKLARCKTTIVLSIKGMKGTPDFYAMCIYSLRPTVYKGWGWGDAGILHGAMALSVLSIPSWLLGENKNPILLYCQKYESGEKLRIWYASRLLGKWGTKNGGATSSRTA